MPMPKNSCAYRKKARTLLIFSILWALLLSLLSVQPENVLSPFVPFPFMFTAGHAVMYFILTWLLSLHCRFRRKSLITLSLFSVIPAIIWGIINEGLQLFEPSRVPSADDILVNASGALLAGLMFVIWRKVKIT